jgi:hypothetical protein
MNNESEPENIDAERQLAIQMDLEQLENEPQTHPAALLLRGLIEPARLQEKRVYGQLNIESDRPEGLNILMTAFPSGDGYCWFIAHGFFALIVLVNEKWKCIALVPVTQQGEFQGILNQATNGLNIKNGYPVMNPDDFVPHPTGTNIKDNPADTANNG